MIGRGSRSLVYAGVAVLGMTLVWGQNRVMPKRVSAPETSFGSEISGRVSPRPGFQLPATVTVTVTGAWGHRATQTVSAADPVFRFNPMPGGEYTLRVEAPGYEISEVRLTRYDLTRSIDIQMGVPQADRPQSGSGPLVSVSQLQIPAKAQRLLEEGVSRSRQGEPEKALKSFRKAVELHPQFAAAHTNMGVIYAQLGQDAEAEKALQTAVSLDGLSEAAHFNLGLLHLRQQRHQLAAESLEQASSLSSKARTLSFLAEAYYQLEAYQKAEAVLQRALTVDPQWMQAHLQLGYVYLQLGRYPEALENLKRFHASPSRGPSPEVASLISRLEEMLSPG